MVNSEQRAAFLNTLQELLTKRQAGFFCRFDRLSVVLSLIDKYTNKNAKVIDLGCGTFALDFLLEDRGYKNIRGIDREKSFQPIFQKMLEKGLLRNTSFHQGDITRNFPSQGDKADLVILNDALFYSGISLPEVLPKVNQILNGNGYFIFDVWSREFYQRFQALYNLMFPKYKAYTKYSMQYVKTELQENGFTVIETRPSFSQKGLMGFIQRAIWRVLRTTNTIYFIARKVSE